MFSSSQINIGDQGELKPRFRASEIDLPDSVCAPALDRRILIGFQALAQRLCLSRTNNMLNLTRQQQTVLVLVILLFLLGWAVKAWRTAHPPPPAISPSSR